MKKLKQSESEWKKELSPEAYAVLRNKGTEMPGTGKLLHNKKEGMYLCGGCGTQLFASDAKFESGTGWPSFDKALPGVVEFHEDVGHGMRRVEVTCAKCGGHLGHVFDDGSKTTGKRFCINSCALKFEKK